MKSLRPARRKCSLAVWSVVIGVLAWSAGAYAAPAAGRLVGAPPQPIPNAKVAIRIARLDQLLPDLEAFLKPLAPSMNAAAIRAQIGNMLGDPTLANLDQTRPIAFVVFELPKGTTEPLGIAALLPVKNDAYVKTFQARGVLTYLPQGGKTLLLAQGEPTMVLARQNMKSLEALVNEAVPGDVMAYVDLAGLMTRFEKEINGGLRQLTMAMQAAGQPAGAAQLLDLEVRALASVLRDIQDVALRLDVTGQALDISKSLQAKAGSGLAPVLDQPAVNPAVLGFLPGKGAITGIVSMNDATAKYAQAKMDEVLAQANTSPSLTAEQRATLKDFIGRAMSLQKTVAADILFADATTGGLSGVTVSEVTDPGAYLSFMREQEALMKKSGLLSMYQGMGMDMQIKFEEKVRTHNDVPIHRFTQKFDMKGMAGMPPEAAGFMSMFTNLSTELAVVGNYVIGGLGGGQQIDAVIDAVKAKKPMSQGTLAAQPLLKESFLLADVHLTRLVGWLFGMLGPMMGPMLDTPEMRKLAEQLRTAQVKPVALAVAADNGILQARLVVPNEPIARIVDMVKTAFTPIPPGATPGAPPAPPKP